MNLSFPLTVADTLALILEGLMRAVAACSDRRRPGGPMAEWLIRLIWTRVSRSHQRIQKLLARFREGRLRVAPVTTKVRAGHGGGSKGAVKGVPLRFGWLLPLVPCEAANFASQLRLALAEPEMVRLLMQSAQARRILKPLCRMLGIEAELLAPVAVVEVVPTVPDAEQVALERAWNLGVVLRPGVGQGPPGDQGWRVALGP